MWFFGCSVFWGTATVLYDSPWFTVIPCLHQNLCYGSEHGNKHPQPSVLLVPAGGCADTPILNSALTRRSRLGWVVGGHGAPQILEEKVQVSEVGHVAVRQSSQCKVGGVAGGWTVCRAEWGRRWMEGRGSTRGLVGSSVVQTPSTAAEDQGQRHPPPSRASSTTCLGHVSRPTWS